MFVLNKMNFENKKVTLWFKTKKASLYFLSENFEIVDFFSFKKSLHIGIQLVTTGE